MRAVLVDPTERRLVLDDVPAPEPAAGQLLVRVGAAGVNRADLAVTAGTYHGRAPSERFVAGSELAGEVVEVGAGVEGWAVGDRVMAMGAGFAELAAVHASVAMPVPPALDDATAGSLPVALATMHDALATHGGCAPGRSVVVNAASSGVGVVGVRMALQLGASTVIGTSRSADKRGRLSDLVGDDRFVAVAPDDLLGCVAERTGGNGVDVIVDNVGAAALADNIAAAAVLGRIVQVGRLGGRSGTLDLDELARKRISLIGVTFRARSAAARGSGRGGLARPRRGGRRRRRRAGRARHVPARRGRRGACRARRGPPHREAGDPAVSLHDDVVLGMSLPHRSPDPIPEPVVRHVAQRADELGFHDLWVTNNTVDVIGSFDSLTVLTYAAALTTRIRLGVSVMVLPTYHPVHVAHVVATLDQLSGGRATLGVGLGRVEEYPLFQVPVERRVRRFTESIALIRALWADEEATFEGEVYTADRANLGVRPVQQLPPIWLGSFHPDALRRAARIGDGWMGAGGSGTASFAQAVPILREALAAEGRADADFPISKRVFLSVHDDGATARAEVERWFTTAYGNPGLTDQAGVFGTPDEVGEQLTALVDAGATHLLLNPVTRFEAQLEVLAGIVGLA